MPERIRQSFLVAAKWWSFLCGSKRVWASPPYMLPICCVITRDITHICAITFICQRRYFMQMKFDQIFLLCQQVNFLFEMSPRFWSIELRRNWKKSSVIATGGSLRHTGWRLNAVCFQWHHFLTGAKPLDKQCQFLFYLFWWQSLCRFLILLKKR